jgi:hypothetical protein
MFEGPKSGRRANIALVALSFLVSLILPEIAYRGYLTVNDPLAPERMSWWLLPAANTEFDAEFGQKYSPETAIDAAIVRNGRVVGCLDDAYRTNVDGLSGATTLADYAHADLKVVLTGDSFSRWRLGGLTIADRLQERLGEATGQRVAVLNFARGGYGLLEMVSMAAAQAERADPALIVVAFITDDLTRGRRWTKTTVIDGRMRELWAGRPDDLDNPDRASDATIVDPRATAEWCEERRQRADRDVVLLEASAFVESEIKRKQLRPDAFAADRTYFYAWLLRRLTGAAAPGKAPRVGAQGFAGDARYQADRQTLRRLGVPLVFVHLPVQPEFAAGLPLASGAAARIWTMIERDFDTKIVSYFNLERRPALPAVYDLEPLDSHPNAAGIEMYAAVAFSAIAQRRLVMGSAVAEGGNSRQLVPLQPAGTSREALIEN